MVALPLTSADWPEVRAAIDTSLTTDDLPDSTIARTVFVSTALRAAKRLDPAWADRTGDEEEALHTAGVLLLAAEVCEALPNLTSENFGQSLYQYQKKFDPATRASALRDKANDLVADYLEDDGDPEPTTAFTTVGGNRGW